MVLRMASWLPDRSAVGLPAHGARRFDGGVFHYAQEFQRQIALDVFPEIFGVRFGTGLVAMNASSIEMRLGNIALRALREGQASQGSVLI